MKPILFLILASIVTPPVLASERLVLFDSNAELVAGSQNATNNISDEHQEGNVAQVSGEPTHPAVGRGLLGALIGVIVTPVLLTQLSGCNSHDGWFPCGDETFAGVLLGGFVGGLVGYSANKDQQSQTISMRFTF